MSERFWPWFRQWLIAVDQLAMVTICFFTFVVLARGTAPNADETISSRVGRNAIAGRKWARYCELAIDRFFTLLGHKPGHCRAAVEVLDLRRSYLTATEPAPY